MGEILGTLESRPTDGMVGGLAYPRPPDQVRSPRPRPVDRVFRRLVPRIPRRKVSRAPSPPPPPRRRPERHRKHRPRRQRPRIIDHPTGPARNPRRRIWSPLRPKNRATDRRLNHRRSEHRRCALETMLLKWPKQKCRLVMSSVGDLSNSMTMTTHQSFSTLTSARRAATQLKS